MTAMLQPSHTPAACLKLTILLLVERFLSMADKIGYGRLHLLYKA